MNKWEEEIELIDNLGLLYPEIIGWYEYDKNWDNRRKAFWIYDLCVHHLDQRMPQLEEFIERHIVDGCWQEYKEHFNVK